MQIRGLWATIWAMAKRRKERAAVELGRRGARERWAKIPPAERARIMAAVRRAGVKKKSS